MSQREIVDIEKKMRAKINSVCVRLLDLVLTSQERCHGERGGRAVRTEQRSTLCHAASQCCHCLNCVALCVNLPRGGRAAILCCYSLHTLEVFASCDNKTP